MDTVTGDFTLDRGVPCVDVLAPKPVTSKNVIEVPDSVGAARAVLPDKVAAIVFDAAGHLRCDSSVIRPAAHVTAQSLVASRLRDPSHTESVREGEQPVRNISTGLNHDPRGSARIERWLRIALWTVLVAVIVFTRTDPDLWGHVPFGLGHPSRSRATGRRPLLLHERCRVDEP